MMALTRFLISDLINLELFIMLKSDIIYNFDQTYIKYFKYFFHLAC